MCTGFSRSTRGILGGYSRHAQIRDGRWSWEAVLFLAAIAAFTVWKKQIENDYETSFKKQEKGFEPEDIRLKRLIREALDEDRLSRSSPQSN
jgi:hypothetical protein